MQSIYALELLQISDAVYKQVLTQTTGQYEALVDACEAQRGPLDARLRTDMDQIITSKEHVSSKIRGISKKIFQFQLPQT